MSVYGLKEYVDNQTATLVVAADTIEEYGQWYTALQSLEGEDRYFESETLSEVMRHLVEPVYKGFRKPVHVIFHTDEEQRDAFFEQQKLVEQKSNPARDRQADMLHRHKEDVREATETEAERNQTIEEKHGLDTADKWDRRSEAEIEADREMKEEMKRRRQDGSVSDDSFADPDAIRAERAKERMREATEGKMSETQAREQLKALGSRTDKEIDAMDLEGLTEELEDEGVEGIEVLSDQAWKDMLEAAGIKPAGEASPIVTDISTTRNEDGSIEVTGIKAVKAGGPVDLEKKALNEAEHEQIVEEKLAGRRSFSPDDFAKVLRGDGSSDAVTGDRGDNTPNREGISRPSLSDHAEQARREFADEVAARAAETQATTEQEAPIQVPVREAGSQTKSQSELSRTVILTPQMWDVIDSKVQSGLYADESEVIRDALRALILSTR